MKKILLSSVALIGLTAGAMAADLPSRRAPAPYIAVPVFTWTGFYVGVNAGYGFSDNNDKNNLGSFTSTPGSLVGAPNYVGIVSNGASGSNDNDGFVGGGQIGYNYQVGNFVFGIEADAQYADLNNNKNNGVVTLTPGLPDFIPAVNRNIGGLDFFGTVRGRIGYAFDRLLVYGTGGFAYGGADNGNAVNGQLVNGQIATGFGGGNNNGILSRTGYAAGGGIEYAFTPSLTGKIEGLYVSLDRDKESGLIGAHALGLSPIYTSGIGRNSNSSDFAVVRAGLNYKFNLF